MTPGLELCYPITVAFNHMPLFIFTLIKTQSNLKFHFSLAPASIKCSVATCGLWLPYWAAQTENISSLQKILLDRAELGLPSDSRRVCDSHEVMNH